MKSIINYTLSRTHSPITNYLLITQCKIVKFDHLNAVKYNPSTKSMSNLESYAVDSIKKDNTDTAKQELFDYLEKDCMSADNTATVDYNYFRVILADGSDIITSNFEDFKKQYSLVVIK